MIRYEKTAQGRDEIDRRSHGLPARARRLLLLIDGRKDLTELASVTGLGLDTDELLAQLQAGGFIAVVGAPRPMPPTPAAVAAPMPTVAPRAEGAAVDAAPADPADWIEVKQLMLDSTRQYLGLMGADLGRRIEAAQDADGLRSCMARWSLALRESRQGQAVAGTYLEQARAVLG
ncbi:hypothetical protein [Chitinimonas koreensis]|uniref:hypothetical protein n=1 Tax=Chitinimonas koreensis TaxID=356302 RepID=UPI0004246A67|nr:hypothetical protein [Chitinimonas koreensis]QNM96168.1 hypothetical protein H9L41_20545 [Chitinimonas koreensis]